MRRDNWASKYLQLRRRGTRPGAACLGVDVPRQTVSDRRRSDPDFARDEQFIRDREDVERAIAEQERNEMEAT